MSDLEDLAALLNYVEELERQRARTSKKKSQTCSLSREGKTIFALIAKDGSTVRSEFACYVPRTLNRTVAAYRTSVQFLKRTVPVRKRRTILPSKNWGVPYRIAILALNQYLNCKLLHGGTLLQPWPNFSGNYVIPSPQLKDQKKKVYAKNWCVFSPKSGEDQN